MRRTLARQVSLAQACRLHGVDAAGLVDPITGEGLYYAIRSGDLAAQDEQLLPEQGVLGDELGARAEQISQAASRFSPRQLQQGLELIFEADRDLRSARPDDRIIMEQFVLRLTGSGDRAMG